MWNKQLESMTRQELQLLQLSRLKEAVTRVYNNVPIFRKRLDAAKVQPDSIKSLADLKRLPYTYKSDLRENYPLGLIAVKQPEIVRLHASSGTKGKPTVVAYTRKDIDTWAEVCARSLACAGVKSGDILHNSYGYGLFTGGLGVHYGAEKLGATVVPASGGKTQQQIMLLQDFQARILCSTPSYALNLAFTMAELGVDFNKIKLQVGIFGAEPWTEELRKEIEERLNLRALDIYGLSEIIGPGVAMECFHAQSGLHIWEDHFLPEIIDPKTGEPLKNGEEGELVFTTLTKEGMPLLRYRTGDLSVLLDEPCSCGRTMIKMNRIKARIDDMLIIRGVNLYPSEIESTLLQNNELTPHYQLIIKREKALDMLEVHVEVQEEIVSRFDSVEQTLKDKLVQTIKETHGLTVAIKLLPPRSIARSEGKAVRVIDQRNNS